MKARFVGYLGRVERELDVGDPPPPRFTLARPIPEPPAFVQPEKVMTGGLYHAEEWVLEEVVPAGGEIKTAAKILGFPVYTWDSVAIYRPEPPVFTPAP